MPISILRIRVCIIYSNLTLGESRSDCRLDVIPCELRSDQNRQSGSVFFLPMFGSFRRIYAVGVKAVFLIERTNFPCSRKTISVPECDQWILGSGNCVVTTVVRARREIIGRLSLESPYRECGRRHKRCSLHLVSVPFSTNCSPSLRALSKRILGISFSGMPPYEVSELSLSTDDRIVGLMALSG